MANIRALSNAIEQYSTDHGFYPNAVEVRELVAIVGPSEFGEPGLKDGWDHWLRVSSTASTYEIRSLGSDHERERSDPRGVASGFDADIVLIDGQFVQWPEPRCG